MQTPPTSVAQRVRNDLLILPRIVSGMPLIGCFVILSTRKNDVVGVNLLRLCVGESGDSDVDGTAVSLCSRGSGDEQLDGTVVGLCSGRPDGLGFGVSGPEQVVGETDVGLTDGVNGTDDVVFDVGFCKCLGRNDG